MDTSPQVWVGSSRRKVTFVTDEVYLSQPGYLKEIFNEKRTPMLWETLVNLSANLIVCTVDPQTTWV